MKKETEIEKRAREIGSEPAFPTSSLEGAFGSTGLTKLEWFAGMVLSGMGGSSMHHYRQSTNTAVAIANHILFSLAEMEVNNG